MTTITIDIAVGHLKPGDRIVSDPNVNRATQRLIGHKVTKLNSRQDVRIVTVDTGDHAMFTVFDTVTIERTVR